MLTDLRKAPVIAQDSVFTAQEREVLDNDVVDVINTKCLWVEQTGSMLANDDEYVVEAALLPLATLTTLTKQAENTSGNWPGLSDWTTDLYGTKVILADDAGTGLLEALALIVKHPTTGTYAAHVFNGYADEILIFEDDENIQQVMDTVVTMFAVVGRSGDNG